MKVTLKMVEKMDHLLDEAEQLTECATKHADDSDLKALYMDLARCHYDGYERLSTIATRVVDRKAQQVGGEKAEVMREMVDWQKERFDERAKKIKKKMEEAR